MATATPPPKPDAPPDSESYYGYLIQGDKAPTPLFAAFLRALARYIIDNIGDTSIRVLSPPKLAAFYKLAGENYDTLFAEAPHASISYIWQVTGCQHSLQPTDDDYAAPSIPALTIKGFVRWQSFQTLLCPDMHVPVLQYAAKNWNLRHPETGELFPPELPKEALPIVPDPFIENWYEKCAEKLRQEADASRKASTAPRSTSVPKARPTPMFKESDYVYSRGPRDERSNSPRAPRARGTSPRPGTSGAADINARAFSFNHVQPRYAAPNLATSAAAAAGMFAATAAAAKWTRKVRLSPPDDERRAGRRRSFSDYPPTPTGPRVKVHSPPFHTDHHEPSSRRHSHPHPRLSASESSDADDDMPEMPPRGARHVPRPEDPPMPSVRRVYSKGPTVIPDPFPPGPIPPGKRESSSSGGDRRRRDERVPFPPVSRSPRRSPQRAEEPRRRSRGISGDLRDKISSMLPAGVLGGMSSNMSKTERPRSPLRTHSNSSDMGPRQRYSKESLQSSKLGRGWSYDSDDDPGSSNGDRHRHRERERERERERDRARRDRRDPREVSGRRERERERDRADHGEHSFRSREKDVDHARDRERERERERERGRAHERRERDLERERDAYALDRGRRDFLRERGKNKSLDRSRDHSRDHGHEPERRDDDRDHRSRRDRDRERERDRYPLRTETLKRPIISADIDR